MSSDEEIKRPKVKKRVVNSDSEDDIEIAQSLEEKLDIPIQQSDESEEVLISKKKFQRVKRTVNSDADSDGNENDALKSPTTNLGKSFAISAPKKSNIFADSDLYDAEGSSDEQPLNSKSSPSTLIKKSNNYGDSDLYDAEGSDDENRLSSLHSMNNKYNDKDLYDAEGSSDGEQQRHSPPPKNSENAKKQQRKSAKAAKSEIEEIHRESQRIVRESNVSLPYHRPKQRTLAEFLQRRKSTPLMSLRTSKDKLNQVWKHLEERELEAVNFYKSDSEHSDEEKSRQNIKLVTSHNSSQITEDLNSEKQIESKRIDLSQTKESNLDEDVIQVIEIMLCTIVANCNESDVLKTNSLIETYEASVDGIAKVIVNPIDTSQISFKQNSKEINKSIENTKNEVQSDTSQISFVQNSEELNKNIENTKSEVQNNTDKISESQNFELHLTESECFSEDITDVQINCVKNKTSTNKLDTTEPILVTPSQNFELHMSESERFSETFHITELKTTDYCTNIEISSDILSNSVSETLKDSVKSLEESKAVQDKITDEPLWMKAALEYEDDEYKNETIQVDKPSIKLNVPKITGGPTEIVDLDDNGSTGVVDLMQRFMKHISLKTKLIHKKSSKQISIVSAERDRSGQISEIKEEIVSVIMTEEEEDDPKLSKPGAKLVKLKAQLQAQIGQRRESEWTKKLRDQRLYEEEIYEGEKSECDAVDENIDESSESNEEEEEDEDEEEEDEDEEEEEDDYNIEKKNKKPKNEFVDEEAEVSEDESGGEGGDEDEDSINSFIKRPKMKQTPLKKIESEDMFASQEMFNNQFEEDEEEDLLTIGQDSKDRRDIEEVSDNEQEHNILTQSPAFPLPAIERKDFENHLSWGSSPTFTQKERFSIFRKEEQSQQASSGLDDLLSTPALPPLTQDLIGLCSGQFSSQPIHCSMLEASQEAGVDYNASQALDHLWLNDDVQSQTQSRKDDVKPNTQLSLILSDDEDILEIKTKARNKRKLDFSDDEEESQEEQNEEEQNEDEGSKINDVEEDFVEEGIEGNVDDVEYDSEENEIPRDGGQFLDKEAELSESEWESEDEDENGLDLLEQEEADKEKIDHDADKEELGKMHIRRMLVEDTKEVKLLQELLLEDGDLHSDGNGRQRLFRWSNQAGDEDIKRTLVGDSDEEKADEDEDEDEEHWRRSRHERETFLREHSKKKEAVEVEDLLEDDSQLFKLGKAALRKIQNSSQEPRITPPTNPLTSPDAKQSFYQQAKRGSFLSRGQQVLSRLVQLTAGASSDAQVSNPKNSRNFVFASISPTKDEPEEPQPAVGTKRKRPVLPLPVAKRPCQTRIANKFSKKRSLLDQLAKCES